MSRKKIDINSILADLARRFPKAIVPDEARRQPLKVGIAADLLLQAAPITRRELGAALNAYTNSPGYLRQMREGATRIDLDGNATGIVTAPEAEHARLRCVAKSAKRQTTEKPQPKSAKAPSPTGDSLQDLKAAALRRVAGNPVASR